MATLKFKRFDRVLQSLSLVFVIALQAPAVAQDRTGQDARSSPSSRAIAGDKAVESKLEALCLARAEIPGRALGIEKRCLRAGSSSGVARADFNKDGFGDLAIGVPFEDVGTAVDAGAVIVIYGSAAGLVAPASGSTIPAAQNWTQDSPGVPGGAQADDRFGAALASGDFNNDGTSDLAIGSPGENGEGGSVTIIHGTPLGLATNVASYPPPAWITADALSNCFSLSGARAILIAGACDPLEITYKLRISSFIAPGTMLLGSSLAWGDFDGDGANDLAVGAPGAAGNVFPLDSGAVVVLYGKQGTPLSSQARTAFVMQEDRRAGAIGGATSEEYDRFGMTLAAGNFNGGQYTDLAIGVPHEDIGTIAGAGTVQVFFGCAQRLDQCNRTIISQNTPGISSDPEPIDVFGFSLAVGNFNADSYEDLVIGAPYENVGDVTNAGVVHVLYGNPAGFDFEASQLWSQNFIFGNAPSPYDGSPSESYDYFGHSLAAADFNGDGQDDLAIGVPYENVVSDRSGTLTSIVDAGEVDVLYGSPMGLSTARTPQMWHQDSINIEDVAETSDLFGYALTAWNFGGVGSAADLAVGVPLEDIGTIECGAVSTLYGSPAANGLVSTSDQFWNQSSAGVPGDCETGDNFGRALY